MTERFIYLVQTQEDYEGPIIIEAHFSEDAAQRQVDACNAYAELAPVCPHLEDPEEQWEAFYKARETWIAGHPLGTHLVLGYLNQLYAVGRVRLAELDAQQEPT